MSTNLLIWIILSPLIGAILNGALYFYNIKKRDIGELPFAIIGTLTPLISFLITLCLFLQMIEEMGLETCPIIYTDYELPSNFDDLFELVDNFKTTFGNIVGKFVAEGLVFVAKNVRPHETITRSNFNRLSFKVKARTYEYGKY